MRKIFLIGLALLTCVSLSAQQHQDPGAAAALQENIQRAGNNSHVYEFDPIHDTRAPKGYKPFYISHYGRHGSRSDWGGRTYQALIRILEQAQADGLLTAEGEALLGEARLVNEAHDGMDGRLMQRGVREHERLAERMFIRYPDVFRKGSKQIRSISSTVQRCIISMVGFTNRLNEMQPDLEFYWDTGEKFMEYINTETVREVREGERPILTALERSYVPDTVFVMQHLFNDPQAARKHVGNVQMFQRMIFETARIAEGADIPTNLFRHIPFDAVYKYWESANMTLYFEHCNSVEFGSLVMPTVERLVNDIVTKADEAISKGNWAADLRFGHDYPLMSLASYLGVEGVGDKLHSDEVSAKWWGFRNIPFASNLQMVFYRNKAGDVLVKFLYNEKECLLRGLEPVSGPYYRWETVKENIKGYLR